MWPIDPVLQPDPITQKRRPLLQWRKPNGQLQWYQYNIIDGSLTDSIEREGNIEWTENTIKPSIIEMMIQREETDKKSNGLKYSPDRQWSAAY